ncbi:hypothetical protein ACWIUD_11505 [Helicobacter sp. 23-1044]
MREKTSELNDKNGETIVDSANQTKNAESKKRFFASLKTTK